MKNEVHLKTAHHTGRHSHYFSQKLSNGPLQMQRWKTNACFHSHLSKTIFTNVTQPISPSSIAFNQCIKIAQLCHICSMKSLFEGKHCFHSPLKIFVESLFPKHQRVLTLLLLLRFRCRCSQINMLPLTKCGNDTSCCTSLPLRCHSSIRSPT